VTDLLRKGDNTVGAILADGWYAGYIGYGHRRNHYGNNLRLLAQLQIEYQDGSSEIIASGPTGRPQPGRFWKRIS
jgi:alpha-L-rhamnosidase